ncbi:MAG: hypothetical protein DMG89_25540 [Acidobacteria bacterium]|nr:MAG: hypothetical protein DMG89_25540 [Acidobacteriota bacterium]
MGLVQQTGALHSDVLEFLLEQVFRQPKQAAQWPVRASGKKTSSGRGDEPFGSYQTLLNDTLFGW